MHSLYVHIAGLDAAVMEVDELPKATDTAIIGRNPRRRDGKALTYIMDDVTEILIPMHMVTFVEILPSGEEEEIESFIRE